MIRSRQKIGLVLSMFVAMGITATLEANPSISMTVNQVNKEAGIASMDVIFSGAKMKKKTDNYSVDTRKDSMQDNARFFNGAEQFVYKGNSPFVFSQKPKLVPDQPDTNGSGNIIPVSATGTGIVVEIIIEGTKAGLGLADHYVENKDYAEESMHEYGGTRTLEEHEKECDSDDSTQTSPYESR
ncbi:hypothetical protein ACFL6Y_12120 [Elusimicrobiota bacterium]